MKLNISKGRTSSKHHVIRPRKTGDWLLNNLIFGYSRLESRENYLKNFQVRTTCTNLRMKSRKRTQRWWEQRATQMSKTLIVFSFLNTRCIHYEQHNTWTTIRWIGPSSLSPLFFGNECRIYNQAGEQSLTCEKTNRTSSEQISKGKS